MYILQKAPAPSTTLEDGTVVQPLLTLKDEFGRIQHVVKKDSEYVLVEGTADGEYTISSNWSAEAKLALKKLPALKRK